MVDLEDLLIDRKESIAVSRIVDSMAEDLELDVVGGFQGMSRPVFSSDVNRPGLALSGYLEFFANDRIQLLGNTEINYMKTLSPAVMGNRLAAIFSFELPAFVVSRNLNPENLFLDMCNRRGVPVIRSSMSTDDVISRIILFLAQEFSPATTMHGTSVDCYGVGCLIVGSAGIGKSETALELVERGHRLIADDNVRIKRLRNEHLYAESNPNIRQHMEIRGVGIVDIKTVFGVGRVRDRKRIGLVVELEEWKPDRNYDRTGLDEETIEILGIKVPYLRIPVRPGRNIAIIIEVAALKHRLKELGMDPAQMLDAGIVSRNIHFGGEID